MADYPSVVSTLILISMCLPALVMNLQSAARFSKSMKLGSTKIETAASATETSKATFTTSGGGVDEELAEGQVGSNLIVKLLANNKLIFQNLAKEDNPSSLQDITLLWTNISHALNHVNMVNNGFLQSYEKKADKNSDLIPTDNILERLKEIEGFIRDSSVELRKLKGL